MLKLYCFLTFIVWSDVFKVKNTPHNQICITNASVYDTFVVIIFDLQTVKATRERGQTT